jgi:hypothetical protein
MRKPTSKDFNYTTAAFPNCCGAAIIHSFSLTGLARYPGQRDENTVDWTELPKDFIGDLNKRFDAACMYNGSTTQYPGAALVCVTLPKHPKRPSYYDHHDKIEEILAATGWEPGPVSIGAHGGYLNQFWARKSPRTWS